MENKVKLECKVCGDIFYVRKSYEKRYSSCPKKECRNKNKKSTALKNLGDKIYKKGNISPPEVLKKAREGAKEWHKNNPDKRHKMNEDTRLRNLTNNPMWNVETRKKVSKSCKGRIAWNKGIHAWYVAGDKHPCWKGDDLVVHHKEEYYINKNNSEDNLITLCRPCHMIIHWKMREVMPWQYRE